MTTAPKSTDQRKKLKGIVICLFIYIIALAGGIGIAFYLAFIQWHPIIVALIADVAATLIVYAFSMLFSNASLYDPYWSVIPPFIAFYWLFLETNWDFNVRKIVVFVLLLIWGIRLTYNWLRRWQGLQDVDWRYKQLKNKNPKLFWLTNLLAIEMLPTILVFIGCLPLYYIGISSSNLTVLDFVGFTILLAAIVIETLADEQLTRFVKNRQNKEEEIKIGLWKISRHPNYLGEIMIWWGLFITSLSAGISALWTIIGSLSITLLFVFISIPMIEARLERRHSYYKEYKKKVPVLLPIKFKK